MKKIAIAVLAMVCMFSYAQAENIIDFDRGSFKFVDFIGSGKTFDISKVNKSVPTKTISVVSNTEDMILYHQLATPILQKLRKEILGMSELSNEFLQLINNRETVVLYNDRGVFLTTLRDNNYYLHFESNDKKLMKFMAKQEIEGEIPQNKQWINVCVTHVSTVMKWINYAWVAVQVYKEVCSQQWQGDPPTDTGNPGGSGSTWHNGQGGNSDYDVNKYLK